MLAGRRIHASTPFDEVAGAIGIAHRGLASTLEAQEWRHGLVARHHRRGRFRMLYAAAPLT
jgi:hypothetical protein